MGRGSVLMAARTRSLVKISVVIPSLNSGRFIGAAIDSALDQSYAPYEVLIQDGGSNDGTAAIAESYGSRIEYRSEADLGQADALNKAIARATGDLIVWLNADDLLSPEALSVVAEQADAHPGADFYFGDFDVIAEDGSLLRSFRSSPYDPWRVFMRGCYIFSGSIYFRRQLLDRVGPFDVRFQACMDFDYLARIGAASAVHVGRSLSRFRVTRSQKSSTIRRTFLSESHSVRRRYAGSSRRLRILAVALSARDSLYLATHRVRNSRAWSTLRGTRTL